MVGRWAGRGSLGVATCIVWAIALVGAIAIAYGVAWPIALFNGGDPAAGWVLGFLAGAAIAGTWAVRTTHSLVSMHRAEGDVFRAPWPPDVDAERLMSGRMLDRRRQPGDGVRAARDLLADLRPEERHGRQLVVEAPTRLFLVAASTVPSIATVDDEAGRERIRVEAGEPSRSEVLEAGRYVVTLARTDNAIVAPRQVHAWWLEVDTGGAGS